MTKDMEHDKRAVIYCSDIKHPEHGLDLVDVVCHMCGNELVAAQDTIDGATQSGHTELMYRCLSHMTDDTDTESIPQMPHWQREELNARGISDEIIDHIMRLMARHSQGDREATYTLEQMGWMT